ncbi:MAG TPA: DNA-binding protein [Actinomycetota bacterium]|nr:DNA-binding protein [Actinomycetota bacterium]
MPFLSSFFHNLTASPDEIRAENLRHWADSIPGAVPITDIKSRERTKVAGVIQNIRIDPRSGGSIEATITDGRGQLVARWLGRSELAGILLGAGLVMEGVVGDHSGELLMLNPEYELVPSPEHG